MENRIHTRHLFKGVNGAITQNSSIKSEIIDLRKKEITGYFSLHTIHVGGTLTVTIEVCSTSGGTFLAPTTAITIMTASVAGSYFISFEPPLAPFMKIVFTETNTAACTSLNAWLNFQ
jgi:hypothetical protein